jgi:hypothetical protein
VRRDVVRKSGRVFKHAAGTPEKPIPNPQSLLCCLLRSFFGSIASFAAIVVHGVGLACCERRRHNSSATHSPESHGWLEGETFVSSQASCSR